jgi:signal transduction histidine kinase
MTGCHRYRASQARADRAQQALAAADLLKSEFIANVSAEVSKPLTVIGFAGCWRPSISAS